MEGEIDKIMKANGRMHKGCYLHRGNLIYCFKKGGWYLTFYDRVEKSSCSLSSERLSGRGVEMGTAVF